MSGIAGVVRTDGAPIERELIARLTQSIAFRGPDEQRTWMEGPVAFGHTLLRTTDESEHERQPFTLDGEVWIVADCRIDSRSELLERMGGTASLLLASDVELILRAYLQWGETCVGHLLGDFAFGIWDGRTRRLFCARDHMGIKPFYYAQVGPWLIFSNTLDCIRLHPNVSDKLNDLAIADFILFGVNQDNATTCFSDIRRLPPAHTITCAGSLLAIRRYWTLPVEEPVYYYRDQECIEHFRSLLNQAVSDRLRTRNVSVFMSGGLDSPALAATAKGLLNAPGAVQAFTLVFDWLIPDSERQYADLMASHLGIPIHFFALDEDSQWAIPGARTTPEPIPDLSDPRPRLRCHKQMSQHSRVALYGEGPDNALRYEWRSHLAWLASHKRWARLLLDLGKHVLAHKRLPLLPTVPRILQQRRIRAGAFWTRDFPAWINPDLVERLHLRERWLAWSSESEAPSAHPVRPMGYSSLQIPAWQSLFEGFEPSYTGATLEVRHPYMDIRILSFLLRVPALPWCRSKFLLRQAMRGTAPEGVRRRPKVPLSKHPDYERAGLHGLPSVIPGPLLHGFAEPAHLPRNRPESMVNFDVNIRFAALSHWLTEFQHDSNRTGGTQS